MLPQHLLVELLLLAAPHHPDGAQCHAPSLSVGISGHGSCSCCLCGEAPVEGADCHALSFNVSGSYILSTRAPIGCSTSALRTCIGDLGILLLFLALPWWVSSPTSGCREGGHLPRRPQCNFKR